MIAPSNPDAGLTGAKRIVEHPPNHGNSRSQRHPARHAQAPGREARRPGSRQRFEPVAHLPASRTGVPRTRPGTAGGRHRQGHPGRPAHGQLPGLGRCLVRCTARRRAGNRREHLSQVAGTGLGAPICRHRHSADAGQVSAPRLRRQHGACLPGACPGARRPATPGRCALSPVLLGVGRGGARLGPGQPGGAVQRGSRCRRVVR